MGGLFWSTNLTPWRVHFFPPPLLCKSKLSMCRQLHEMGWGKEGILHLSFRWTRRHIAAFNLLQIFYLSGASVLSTKGALGHIKKNGSVHQRSPVIDPVMLLLSLFQHELYGLSLFVLLTFDNDDWHITTMMVYSYMNVIIQRCMRYK